VKFTNKMQMKATIKLVFLSIVFSPEDKIIPYGQRIGKLQIIKVLETCLPVVSIDFEFSPCYKLEQKRYIQ